VEVDLERAGTESVYLDASLPVAKNHKGRIFPVLVELLLALSARRAAMAGKRFQLNAPWVPHCEQSGTKGLMSAIAAAAGS
jgi:hypothetical protein